MVGRMNVRTCGRSHLHTSPPPHRWSQVLSTSVHERRSVRTPQKLVDGCEADAIKRGPNAVRTRRSRVNTVVDVHEQRPNTPCTRTEGPPVPGECRSRSALGAERPSSLRGGRKQSAKQLLKSLAARSRLSKFGVYGLPVLGRMGCQRKGPQLGFLTHVYCRLPAGVSER